MAVKKVIERRITVGSRTYDCLLWPGNGGYHYDVHGPVTKISGWVNGELADAIHEATEHAKEKFPQN